MDYEKAYKEALERARMINNGEDVDVEAGTTTCEYIFPELAESEDEKIRKMLIDSFTRADMGGEIYGKGVTYKQVIAWLEKQQGGKDKFTQQHSLKEDSNVNDETNAPTEYGKYVDECLNEASKHFFSEGEDKYSVADLFYAGVRCGKSCLEKQEQKPATIDIDRMVDDYANNKERGNEVFGKPVPCMVRAYRQGLNDAIGKVVLKPAEWNEDYTERMGQIINYLKCQAKEEPTRSRTLLGWVALLKSIFRKGLPEIQIPCTEAARKGIHRIMDVLEWAADKGRISDSDCEDYMILLSAYLPQPKIEWSEEDEKNWRRAIRATQVVYPEAADRLKFLKDKYIWKPSNEQMEVLLSEVNGWKKGCPKQIVLESLYNDLKKLK